MPRFRRGYYSQRSLGGTMDKRSTETELLEKRDVHLQPLRPISFSNSPLSTLPLNLEQPPMRTGADPQTFQGCAPLYPFASPFPHWSWGWRQAHGSWGRDRGKGAEVGAAAGGGSGARGAARGRGWNCSGGQQLGLGVELGAVLPPPPMGVGLGPLHPSRIFL